MRALLCATAVVAVTMTQAEAGPGMTLGWNDCTDGGYSTAMTFACDTNVGVHTLVGGFVAPAGIQAMTAHEVVIDVFTADPGLVPAWWLLRTGQCRANALVAGFDFTGGPYNCYDYWQGGAIGAFNEDPAGSFNRARIKGVFALPSGDSRITSVPEGTSVYSFKLNLLNAKSTGLGACAGCGVEACIVLQSLRLNQPPPLTSIFLSVPANISHALWQGWSNLDPLYSCPGSFVPAKRQTWGSIKALYR